MLREKTIRVRLSESEYKTLKEYAVSTDRMISEVVRDWIKKIRTGLVSRYFRSLKQKGRYKTYPHNF
jgi:hypothetical protein